MAVDWLIQSHVLAARQALYIKVFDVFCFRHAIIARGELNKQHFADKPTLDKLGLKKAQSLAVRELLQIVKKRYFHQFDFISHRHPYFLSAQPPLLPQIFFVNFSHSGEQVALIIAPTKCAIDIELSPISCNISARYFCANECALLAQNTNQSARIRQLLWQARECAAKLDNRLLAQTISADFSDWAAAILQAIASNTKSSNNEMTQITLAYKSANSELTLFFGTNLLGVCKK